MKNVVFILFLCCSLVGKAQSYRLKIIDPVICFDYNRNKVIVIEDSTYRLEISLKTKKVIKKPLKWDGQVSFHELRKEFVPLSEKGSPIFFVDRGCGWLLELRNDSIVRIDQSFHHQNQYGGAYFMHEGRPHVFGGYGLFTTKSIITQYDFSVGQWYLANEIQPHFSFTGSIHKKYKDQLYVLASSKGPRWNKHNHVYAYNFKRNKWKYLFSTKFLDTLNKSTYPLIQENMVIHGHILYEFDFNEGKLEKYKLRTDNWCKRIKRFNECYVLLSTLTNHTSQTNRGLIQIYSPNEFKNKFGVAGFSMYRNNKSNKDNKQIWIWLILCFIGLIIVIIGCRYKKTTNKVAVTTTQISSLVGELIVFWLKKPSYVLELSEINDFVNYDEPSPDTLKKRRETLLKQLCFEVAQEYGFLEDNIYTTQSHPKDKRMKLLVLNSMLVNKIKKENSSKFI